MPPFCHVKHSRLSYSERFIFRHGFRLTWSPVHQWAVAFPPSRNSSDLLHIHSHLGAAHVGTSIDCGNNKLYLSTCGFDLPREPKCYLLRKFFPLYYSTFRSLKLLSSDKHSCSGGLDVSWFVKLTQIMSNMDLSLLFPASTFPERDVLLLFPASVGLTAASSL